MNSQRLWQHVQVPARLGPSAEREKWTGAPIPNQEAIFIGKLFQGKNQFSPLESHLVY